MIVGVIGTSGPFDRLVDGLASYAAVHPDQAVWVQHGRSHLPAPLTGEAFVGREALLDRMDHAQAIVCHAGCGTLVDALSKGHLPVVMPRLARFGEHVNDHQLELLRALGDAGRIIPVDDVRDLGAAIDRARARGRRVEVGEGAFALTSALSDDLRDLDASERGGAAWRWSALRILTGWIPRRGHHWP